MQCESSGACAVLLKDQIYQQHGDLLILSLIAGSKSRGARAVLLKDPIYQLHLKMNLGERAALSKHLYMVTVWRTTECCISLKHTRIAVVPPNGNIAKECI